MVKAKSDKETVDTNHIFAEAVAAAREENRRHGLASPCFKDGKVHYELPDGTITDQRPAFFDKIMEELRK